MTSASDTYQFAPYAADKIIDGKIVRPREYKGHLWISTGNHAKHSSGLSASSIYRIIPFEEYKSPMPELPIEYKNHTGLPDDHPARYTYEGMITALQGKRVVLTDEHTFPDHPWGPDQNCIDGKCLSCPHGHRKYHKMTPEQRRRFKVYHFSPIANWNWQDYKLERSIRNIAIDKPEIDIELQPSLL